MKDSQMVEPTVDSKDYDLVDLMADMRVALMDN
jgi:hypothetical protein